VFTDPEKNLEQFDLQKGMRVADFGSGSGFYATTAARLVGDKGKVFAVDIQKDLLTRLKKDAAAKKLLNIEIIWGDLEKAGGAKLKDGSVDRAIISNLLFQIGEKENLVKEAARAPIPSAVLVRKKKTFLAKPRRKRCLKPPVLFWNERLPPALIIMV